MAITLLGVVQDILKDVDARYSEYQGRRIPCRINDGAYHLRPAVADRHCGKFSRTLVRGMCSGITPTLPWRHVMESP